MSIAGPWRERGEQPGSDALSTTVVTKLRAIQDGGLRAADIARLLGTRPETVSRWNSGRNRPRGARLHRLLELEFIVMRLTALDPPEALRLWLFSRHQALDGRRPADLIEEGRIDAVLRAIDQRADGASP